MQSLIPPFDAYQGDKPYVFVSYAHKNSDIVYEHIRKLHDAGFRIWYDEGIDPGADWSDEIASALQGCAAFLVFVSEASLASQNVRKEIIFAIDQRKHMLCVHIEEVELPIGLKMQLGNIQALLETRFHDKDKFYRRLHEGLLPNQTLRVEGETHTMASKQYISATPSTSRTPAQSNASTKIIAALVAIIVMVSAGAGYMWLQQSESTSTSVENAKVVEKELSVDPRKELASMGLSWSVDDYVEQVQMADMKTVKLFYDGGFDPYTTYPYYRTSHYFEHVVKSPDLIIAFQSIAPMAAVVYDIWKSESARSVLKLALGYGYSPQKDAAFLENFVKKLDILMEGNVLNEKQLKETLLFLKSLDKNILETFKTMNEDILTLLENNTYKEYVESTKINTLNMNLSGAKQQVESIKASLQENPNNKIYVSVYTDSYNREVARVKKLEAEIVKYKEERRTRKLEFHQKYIKILDELMV